jgi:hypothetical protein
LMMYEGLLSAAGKELGRIEDASVSIAMLRMVSVVLVADDATSVPDCITVPNLPYLKWLQLTPFGVGSNMHWRLVLIRSITCNVSRSHSRMVLRFARILYSMKSQGHSSPVGCPSGDESEGSTEHFWPSRDN